MKNSRYQTIKSVIDDVINKDENEASKAFDIFIVTLILLNVLAIILESFDDIMGKFAGIFSAFETFSVIVFTIEYVLRIWTAGIRFKGKNSFTSAFKFIFTPMGIIDFLAIAPSILPMFGQDWLFIRMLRLITRILRIFKLNRYTKAIKLILKVVKEKKEELLVTVFITFVLLLVAAALMFNLEHEVHADAFPNIGSALWWAVATLTTIGYGDIYPVTAWGKVLSGIIAMLGIGLVALPTGIISSSFMEEIGKNTRKNDTGETIAGEEAIATQNQGVEEFTYCPHCGKMLKEHVNDSSM